MSPKYKLYKIVAVFLALIMFCTSATYSVDFHYCEGELKSFSLFGKAKPCYEQKVTCPHHAAKGGTIGHMGCCNNETIVVSDLDIDFNIPSLLPIPGAFLSLTPPAFDSWKKSMLDVVEYTTPKYMNYRPPLPEDDLRILYQRFLI